jgi:hypothetical protein
MKTEPVPKAAKKSPRSHDVFVTFLYHLVACLTGNAPFANVNPTAAMLKAIADGLAQANAAVKGGGKAATAARNAKRKDAEEQVDHLVDSVNAIVKAAGADAPNAASMILSTGLPVRATTASHKPPLAVKHGAVSGDVLLAALAVARSAVYYWSWSLDMKSWTSVPDTFTARTTITGLTPGQVYYFRFQAKTRKGMTGFSDAVQIMVL